MNICKIMILTVGIASTIYCLQSDKNFKKNLSELKESSSSLLDISENIEINYIEHKIGKYRIALMVHDILKIPADAIVNAANEACLGGGGIDGIITKAGGKKLAQARLNLPEIKPNIRCPLGEARITIAGDLAYPDSDNSKKLIPYKYVVHAVGPMCMGAITEKDKNLLANTYINVLKRVEAFNKNLNPIGKEAEELYEFKLMDVNSRKPYQIKTINFPAISAGIFECLPKYTARVIVKSIIDYLNANPNLSIDRINLIFLESDKDANYIPFKNAFAELL